MEEKIHFEDKSTGTKFVYRPPDSTQMSEELKKKYDLSLKLTKFTERLDETNSRRTSK